VRKRAWRNKKQVFIEMDMPKIHPGTVLKTYVKSESMSTHSGKQLGEVIIRMKHLKKRKAVVQG
jgi:hypothetical protein